MTTSTAMSDLRAIARKIAKADAAREALMAERDDLMRQAKAEGATWTELQEAAGMHSPTAVARALKRGVSD